ncbi:TIGR02594 family protein [Cruoricaptor ignavus]|uniref:TIGR02594 family protein n=1 Tax=Cruoricaptor ignavus TaxID=1118202 RepID=UPI00370D057E
MDKKYNFIKDLKAPKVMQIAKQFIGTKEIIGKAHNNVIMGWAKELGLKEYTADEIPWCGLFVAYCVKKAGYDVVKSPLWARSWADFGTAKTKLEAAYGDILVFVRNGGGHVGFYVAEDTEYFHVLGGNQGDAVSIVRIAKNRCIAVRRCPWKVGQPSEVKKYFVSGGGKVSTNEA